MDTQKKGSFSRWSGDSARWYEAASEYTHYHDKLKTYIAPYLNTEETCCELACGSGTLARCLAPLTARYTANDIDPDSLKFCRARQTERPVPNLEFLPGDWSEVLKNKTFDTVIFSYFSAVFTGWEQLKRLARKKPSFPATVTRKSQKKRKPSPQEAVSGNFRTETQLHRQTLRLRPPVLKKAEKKDVLLRRWKPSPGFSTNVPSLTGSFL